MRKQVLASLSVVALSSILNGCAGGFIDDANNNSIAVHIAGTKDSTSELKQVKVLYVSKTSKRARPIEPEETVLPNGIQFWGLRKFPYPYRAMLAISSDADHETLRKFNLIHQFINTTADTPLGKGLGLDFADSVFMYNGSNTPTSVDYGNAPIDKEFSYFRGVTGQIYGGQIIDEYIHDGWIDTMHSYGDFTQEDPNQTLFSRHLAEQAIHQLNHAGDVLTVWTDHGNKSNVDNFGSFGTSKFYNYQQGASPTSRYYHTDLTIPYGVKFVWTDRPNSSFGYSSIIYPLSLPDGRRVWGFSRYTGKFNGKGDPEWMWSADNLVQQLTWANMKSIIWKRQYAILAQHLSANNSVNPLPQNGIDGLRMLAYQFHRGNILVARTSRLLAYNVTQQFIRYKVEAVGDKAIIHIDSIDDPVFGMHVPTIDEIRGVTFYTSDPKNTVMEIGNTAIANDFIQRNPKDYFEPSISVKWFPQDTSNYAISDPSVS